MKKYFAKFLPVEGTPGQYDIIMNNEDDTCCFFNIKSKFGLLTIDQKYFSYLKNPRKADLFLCCNEPIKKGDMYCWEGKKNNWFLNTCSSRGDAENLTKCNDIFKVVAKISDNAHWVKKGDSFNEDELEFFISSNDKRNKYIEIGDPVYIKTDTDNKFLELEGIVKEFIPFDLYSNSDWWDQLVLITNAFKPKINKKTGLPIHFGKKEPTLIPIDDFKTERKNIRFKPTFFNMVKIKCSQCDTFH